MIIIIIIIFIIVIIIRIIMIIIITIINSNNSNSSRNGNKSTSRPRGGPGDPCWRRGTQRRRPGAHVRAAVFFRRASGGSTFSCPSPPGYTCEFHSRVTHAPAWCTCKVRPRRGDLAASEAGHAKPRRGDIYYRRNFLGGPLCREPLIISLYVLI